MTDARVLLERHKPRLVYDSQEAYFADSAGDLDRLADERPAPRRTGPCWPSRRSSRSPSSARTSTRTARRCSATDMIGETHARLRRARRRDAPPGRATATASTATPGATRRAACGSSTGSSTTTTTSSWLGPLLERRQARGRLGARADPARRGRAARAGGLLASTRPPRARPGATSGRHGQRRRSSTSRAARTRTTSAPGSHWTGAWFDQADGKGPQITPTLEVVEDASPPGCCGPAAGATPRRRARRWTREPEQPRPPPALARTPRR